ncbi:hypothetical protein FNV43_RR25550 [Rhamnella rubrinervis]|uniref:Transcription repressor n=1 Tax=Rhamnella rubrinervis TaxID=2594499 RepID=A0A8K0DNJ9_9ROSA|nr:hypothetical protein FNV43_RR25550 [Rhamnella rubrinervis]
MAKKIKMKLLPSLFKTNYVDETTTNTTDPVHQWHYYLPSCNHPKTLSFRAGHGGGDDIIKTVNSVFLDPVVDNHGIETPDSWFTSSSECASFSTESEEFDGESLEMVVRGARSERLFFEPGDTSSILDKTKEEAAGEACSGGGDNEFDPFKESLVLAMESEDPYEDFRRSMEEMVECHGLKDWECLEELLGWYLKVNGKDNHGFIVEAFVDLLVSLSVNGGANNNNNNSSTVNNDSTSFSSAISSFSSSSPSSSPLVICPSQGHEVEIEVQED